MTVTVVTGANSGIGRATALRLAAAGHEVYGTMRSLDRGEKLFEAAGEAGVTVHPAVMDVTDDQSVAAAFSEIHEAAGPVDVLVNNAGIGSNAAIGDIDIASDKATFDANVWGPVRCTQAVLPGMRERGSGHIVQISSIAGRVGIPGQPMYCASKWALEGMSENMAHDLAPFGIRVSIVEPGVTRTAILAKNVATPESSPHAATYDRMLDIYATGIVANVRPEVVAATVLECIDASPGQLRWPVAWGAAELCGARQAGGVSDAEWTELGTLVADGPAWRARFEELFGLGIVSATGE